MGVGEVRAGFAIVRGGIGILRECTELWEKAQARKRRQAFWKVCREAAPYVVFAVMAGTAYYLWNTEQSMLDQLLPTHSATYGRDDEVRQL